MGRCLVDGSNSQNGDFSRALESARSRLAALDGEIPSDPADRSNSQNALALAALLIRTELETAEMLWKTSAIVAELLRGQAQLEQIEPAPLLETKRFRHVPRAEVTAKVLAGMEEALGVSRNGRPVRWDEELKRLPGQRFRPRRQRRTVAAILGPGNV
jgi:hypothetical protein